MHLFDFALSLNLGDYFTHLANTEEQDGRAGKQLQFGKGRAPRPSVIRQSHPNTWTVIKQQWQQGFGEGKKGKEKFGDILT